MSAVASTPPATRTIASLPGPRTLPLIGNLHQFDARRSHQIFESMARKYGPAFKFKLGPHQLVVLADAEAAMKVLRDRPNEFTRSRVTRPIFEELGVQGLFAAEGDDWRRQRPIIMRTLDPGHLKRFFPTVVTACERLLRRWQATGGGAVEVRDDLTRFTVDIICSLAFGSDVATLDQHDPDPLQKHLDRIFSGINRRMFAPFPFWRYYKTAADRDLEKSKVVVFQAVEGYIANARVR